MKQVILIKWGEAKENYKDYYSYLNKQKIEPFKAPIKRWNRNLDICIWENYDFLEIKMPNRHFAEYEAWKIIFEKYIEFLNDEVILIWYSLGWTFVSKYFNEENNINKIKKIILVAPWFRDDDKEVLWSFNFDWKLNNLNKISEKIVIFWSKDDFLVDFSDIEDFKERLVNSKFNIFEDRWHFLQEDFPELIEEIKKD